MAIYWLTPGFIGRTFKLCVLTRWDFNFCIRSSPLRGHDGYRVTCVIEVENWTRFRLTDPHVQLNGGVLTVAPSSIVPAAREVMVSVGWTKTLASYFSCCNFFLCLLCQYRFSLSSAPSPPLCCSWCHSCCCCSSSSLWEHHIICCHWFHCFVCIMFLLVSVSLPWSRLWASLKYVYL